MRKVTTLLTAGILLIVLAGCETKKELLQEYSRHAAKGAEVMGEITEAVSDAATYGTAFTASRECAAQLQRMPTVHRLLDDAPDKELERNTDRAVNSLTESLQACKNRDFHESADRMGDFSTYVERAADRARELK